MGAALKAYVFSWTFIRKSSFTQFIAQNYWDNMIRRHVLQESKPLSLSFFRERVLRRERKKKFDFKMLAVGGDSFSGLSAILIWWPSKLERLLCKLKANLIILRSLSLFLLPNPLLSRKPNYYLVLKFLSRSRTICFHFPFRSPPLWTTKQSKF